MGQLAIVACVLALGGATAAGAQYGVPPGTARIGKPAAPLAQPCGESQRCHLVSSQRERRRDASCGPQARREFEIQEVECARLQNGNLVSTEVRLSERPLDCVEGDLEG